MEEREETKIAALHLEGEANAWWCSHLNHTRVTYFSEFTQELIRTFDEEILEERRPTRPWEEASTSALIALREKPSASTVGSAITLKIGPLATIEDVPKTHRGMHKSPCLNISENFMERVGDLFAYGLGSNGIINME